MKETIYSIRFPLPREPDVEAAPDNAELNAEVEKLFDDFQNKSEFIPIPERVEKAEELISRAVKLAGELELNMDIERNDDRIDFRFYDSAGLYFGALRRFFGKMFLACDTVMMYPPKTAPSSPPESHWKIVFSCYTHRHLVAGRELYNFE